MTDQIHIGTPESVDLSLEPAGLGSRFLAFIIDAAIQWGVMSVLLFFVAPAAIFLELETGGSGFAAGTLLAILLLGVGFLFFLYKLLLEAFWNGQTVGKRVAGIRVVRADGLPVGFLQVVVRNFMRIIDSLPSAYLVGGVVVLASRRGQRLGDMLAGTVVVRQRRAAAPVLPVQLFHQPNYDLNSLREKVLRLEEGDLVAARGFWERRTQLEPEARYRVAASVASALATRMAWQEAMPPHPEMFIEAVLYVRAR